MTVDKKQPWRILIIDDDEEDYLLARSMLKKSEAREIHLEWANSYERGYERLCRGVYDAVLVDYDLGELTGIDLIREMVAMDYPAPLILFTGRGSSEVDSEALKAGATLYITKIEVNPMLLERSIRYAIERKQIEVELHRERALLEAVIQQLPAGVIIAEAPSGRIIQGSESIRKLFGESILHLKEIEEYPGSLGLKPDGSPYLPEEWPLARSILKGEVVTREEVVIQFEGNKRRTFCINSSPVYRNGQIIAGVVVMNEITQRKQMEEDLAFQALVLKNVQDAIIVVDNEKRITFWNPTAERLYGWKAEEALGQVEPVLLKSELSDEKRAELFEDLKKDGYFTAETVHSARDGKKITVEARVISLRDEAKETTGLVCAVRDISERVRVEQELRQSEERFRTSVETMLDGMAILSAVREEGTAQEPGRIVDFRYEYINEAGCQLNRRAQADHIGKTLLQLLPNHKAAGYLDQYIHLVETGEPLILENEEYEEIFGDGEPSQRFFDSRAARLGDGFVVTWREVTSHRVAIQNYTKVLAALQESERRLQLAHAAAHLGSWNWTAGDDFVVASETFFHLHGIEPPQDGRLTLEDYFALIHPSDRQRLQAYTIRAIQGEPYDDIADKEFRVLLPDGSLRWMAAYQKPIREGEMLLAISGVTMDITELVLAEQAARRGENHMRQVLDSMFSFVGVLTPDGKLLEANRAALEAAGIAFKDVFNKPFDESYWWSYSPEVQNQLREAIRRAAAGESIRYDVLIRTAGDERMIIDFMLAPMLDEEGNVQYLIPSAVEITNRKQAEDALQEYAHQLERSNQDLEEFAFVASHDLQEPLRKIRAFSENLLNSQAIIIGEKERDYLERILNAAVRMTRMLTDLLAYSRVSTQFEEVEEVDLQQIAEEVITDLEVSMSHTRGRVEIGELPVIQTSPTQMRQLFQNLISNGLKFHKPGEPPQVSIRARSLPGNLVQIEVEDNGIGFDSNKTDSLFQPFQRLVNRKDYEGSGIGLAVCRKIVERQGGEISAESVPGEGAVFRIRLPRKQTATISPLSQ
jgi:PAS domain S-box-containing protein